MNRDRGYIKRNNYDRRDSVERRPDDEDRRRRDSNGSPEDRFRRHRRSSSSSPRRRSPSSRRRSPSPRRGNKNRDRRRSPTPDKNSRRARNNEIYQVRPETPTKLIMAIKSLKKSLVRAHGDAVVDRDDKKAKMCEWGVDRLDWGAADVRKHYDRQEAAIRACNETNAELERHMMNEAKRKAITDVHMRFEGKDLDLSDSKPGKTRPVTASSAGSHCENCNECINCENPLHQVQDQHKSTLHPQQPYQQPAAQQLIYADPRTGQQYYAGHNPNPFGTPAPPVTPVPTSIQQQPQQNSKDPTPASTPLPGQPAEIVRTPTPTSTPLPGQLPEIVRTPTPQVPPEEAEHIESDIPNEPPKDLVQDLADEPVDYDTLLNTTEDLPPAAPVKGKSACVIS